MRLNEITQTRLEQLLSRYNISDYTIRNDGLVDVNGLVNLSNREFKKFPIKFGKITGDFFCDFNNNLSSLEGGPQSVDGHFRCICCNLTSLKGGPKRVGGNYSCYQNNVLTSLEGAPEEVGGNFNCHYCMNLESLKGMEHSIIKKNFDISVCLNLKSLNYLPKQINGELLMPDVLNVRNYLIIFKTKGITKIQDSNLEIETIINKYLPTKDVIGCQDELIEAGLEEYARTK
jgi:hypothetical protein